METKSFLLAFSVACTAAILYYSSLSPSGPAPVGPSPSGELMHFAAYGIYAALVSLTAKAFGLRKGMIYALAIAAVLGAVSEIIQLFVPGRFCDFNDWLVDIAGAFAFLLALSLLKRARKPNGWMHENKSQTA